MGTLAAELAGYLRPGGTLLLTGILVMILYRKGVREVTLLGQNFVVNPDLTVEAAAKEAGATITGFVRLEVGEGIEVEKEDFAAEVAKAAQG